MYVCFVQGEWGHNLVSIVRGNSDLQCHIGIKQHHEVILKLKKRA